MKKGAGNVALILSIIPLIILAGLRDGTIGTDTLLYPYGVWRSACRSHNFNQLMNMTEGYVETGYLLEAYIISRFSNIFNVFLTVTHIIILGSIVFAFKLTRINFTYALFMFMMIYFNNSLNITRQSIALAFCLISFAYMLNSPKWLPTFLTILIAYQFHHSAALFLIIPTFYIIIKRSQNFMNKKSSKILFALILILVLFSFTEILEYAISKGLTEEKYMDRYGSVGLYGSNLPISSISLHLFNLIFFYIISKKEKKTTHKLLFEYILITGFILTFLSLISTFAVRVSLYFSYMALIIIPYYIQHYPSKKKWWGAGFYIFYWIMITVVANLDDVYPYSSVILGIY